MQNALNLFRAAACANEKEIKATIRTESAEHLIKNNYGMWSAADCQTRTRTHVMP